MFDEYTEELNDEVRYGVLYTSRVITDYHNINDVTSDKEERITLALKLQALIHIRDDVMEEYAKLEEQYKGLIDV